jgi:ABC-2 type transport system ATP-binding protein
VSVPAVEVTDLVMRYGEVTAVDGLSLRVEPATTTAILGPNGAGKTTTLRMLLNLVMPTAGTATIGGHRYADLPEPAGVVGAVLEASSAHKGRTGRNHLKAGCLTNGLPMSRADEVLDLVGLMPAADRKFKGYSLGMRQRLGIAAAMLGDPRVLILDEPANGLDPEGIRWMRELLQKLAGEGRTVLVSSHLLSEMQALADDVVIVAAGQLVRQGTVAHVLASMSGERRVKALTPEPEKLIAALIARGAIVDAAGPEALLIGGATAAMVGDTALAAEVALHELTTQQPDLEDVFLDLTNAKAAIR